MRVGALRDGHPMTEDGVPFGRRIAELALADPDGTGALIVHSDGSETSLTWYALETHANGWVHYLATSDVRQGANVALCLPNSAELVFAALACWKLGAVPIPMRWDLPEWELQRLLDVIDPVLVVFTPTPDKIEPADSILGPLCETAVSPAVNGICSSGSSGLPKVILNTRPGLWTPALALPFMER